MLLFICTLFALNTLHNCCTASRDCTAPPAWNAGRPNPTASTLLGPHAGWVLPPLLQLTACLHGIYQPGARAQLAPLDGLFAMPPAERAVYLRQSNTAAKVCVCVCVCVCVWCFWCFWYCKSCLRVHVGVCIIVFVVCLFVAIG